MHSWSRPPIIFLTAIVCSLIASGLAPADRLTWFLEVLPVLIALPILTATYRSAPLTPLLYGLLTLHAAILIVGGQYTYAHVPLGYWMQDLFGFTRNHFDRIGHFAQGFVPALVIRELLLKTSMLQPGRWLFFLVCSVSLAFSALYELFEWGAAIMLGQSAMEFLGTQGDQWDTQWDMFLALIGAITGQLLLGRLHTRQLLTQGRPDIDAQGRRRAHLTRIAIALIIGTQAFTPLSALAVDNATPRPESPLYSHGTHSPLEREHLGLFDGAAFTLTSGRCTGCRTPPQALWYFTEETVAIPSDLTAQTGQSAVPQLPFLVWLGSPELIAQARLTADHRHLDFGEDSPLSLRLVAKLPTNQSYYNDATAAFFGTHPLRLRGRTVLTAEGPAFEARTIWPADFLLTPDQTHTGAPDERTISQLIENSPQSATGTITTHLLWGKADGAWAGKPILGAILNGAQGDDDEAHGGHFGIVTGRLGPQGEWADWLVNNFYDPDVVSEKGILPAMVPMDNYLMDLNSGQSYYRPSALLVAVLKQDRIPAAYQATIQDIFRRFYRHELDYDHSLLNCAGFSIDELRRLGWQIPLQGASNRLKATAGYVYMAASDRSLASGLKAYRYFSEERTRLLPRVTFEAIGNDLLHLLRQSDPPRALTPFEQWLREDVEALLYVHIPQIPSSRAMGTYAVASLDEYQQRVPSDRSQWKTVAVPPRPFPSELRVAPAPVETAAIPNPVLALAAGGLLGFGWMGRLLIRWR